MRESEGEMGGIGKGEKEVGEGGAEKAELQKGAACPFQVAL